ncbi:MAG TPA: ATPase, partial [Candidatus Omnitrophota bacterium]|nr:ATPase [Candidatus Omnitrophota bacterium]
MDEGMMKALEEEIRKECLTLDGFFREIENVIVGQKYLVERILLGLLAGGHILIEGLPGLAKT